MAFEHDTADPPIAILDLFSDCLDDGRLILGLLTAVAVARIDHQAVGEPRSSEGGPGRIDACGIVVRRLASPQNNVTVGIARSRGDGAATLFGDSQEMMGMRGGL